MAKKTAKEKHAEDWQKICHVLEEFRKTYSLEEKFKLSMSASEDICSGKRWYGQGMFDREDFLLVEPIEKHGRKVYGTFGFSINSCIAFDGYKDFSEFLRLMREYKAECGKRLDIAAVKEIAERRRTMYPKGTRVELISMDDPYTKLLPGDKGTVETVALLTRKYSNSVNVVVEVDTKTMSAKERPPMGTYKNIRAWIQEEFGLKVSTANIAAMKDELGLDKQFSYDDAGMAAKRRPDCPEEKKVAIIKAFEHFGMIEAKGDKA